MLIRCYDKQHPSYANFGAKGVEVSYQWKGSFEQFLMDLKLKPNPDVRLARNTVNDHYSKDSCYWYNGLSKEKVIGVDFMALHTLYKFNQEWYRFWLVEYDYGRPAKVLRTEDYQAPMTLLADDLSFTRIIPASDQLAEKWIAKFGEKFGYQHARRIDNGNTEYIEENFLPLLPS